MTPQENHRSIQQLIFILASELGYQEPYIKEMRWFEARERLKQIVERKEKEKEQHDTAMRNTSRKTPSMPHR